MLAEFPGKTRLDRYIPVILRGEVAAFHRIFFGHDHRPTIPKTYILWPEGMVIRKGMGIQLQPGLLQRAKKTLRVADPGHGMHTLRAKPLQCADPVWVLQVVRITLLQGHAVLVAITEAIHHHQVDLLQAIGRASCRERVYDDV